MSGGEVRCPGSALGRLPCSSPELGSDDTIRFRFKDLRTRDRIGGAGEGEGDKGGDLRSPPSVSTNNSGGFLGVFNLGLAVVVEAPDSVDRLDPADFGFAVDLPVGLGLETGFGVVTCACGPRLDLSEVIFFGGVTECGSVGAGVTVVRRLVSIRTNGTSLLGVMTEPVFFATLGSEASGFEFAVTLDGEWGCSSSVSSSL